MNKAKATMKLRLGKGSSFVKSRLLRYPQEDAVWEADFQPIPDEKHVEFWLGMVVNQEVSVDLAHQVLNAPPTVNDLARILGKLKPPVDRRLLLLVAQLELDIDQSCGYETHHDYSRHSRQARLCIRVTTRTTLIFNPRLTLASTN